MVDDDMESVSMKVGVGVGVGCGVKSSVSSTTLFINKYSTDKKQKVDITD